MRDAALDDVVMTDVAPFSMGIGVTNTQNGRIVESGLYLPIIERNTVIPASRSTEVGTIVDNQPKLRIRVFQGESRQVINNIALGELTIAIPAGPAGTERVDVRFTYDVSGLLEVETRVLSTGIADHLVIEGHPGILSRQEIADRLAVLAKLKIHPRDDAQNQAVMARAERLFEERLGDERRALAQAIDQFRTILESQNPNEIADAREKFTRWLDDIDRSFFS
jgi:molecular chaperone HscC